MNENELEQIADDLDRIAMDEKAILRYDVMSDALLWSDELPQGRRVRELWCMRPVLRYRTGLILGLDLQEFRADWEAAKRSFPQWIGFQKARSERNIVLENEYHRLSKK